MAEYMMKIYRGESSMTPYKRENDYLNDLVNAMLVFEQKGGLPINGIETPATRTKKGIVFTNFKIVLRLLEQTLKWLFPDVEIFRITADLKPNQRLDVVNQFNNYDGKAVLLASLKTANVGLNITGGKFIVFQDFDFNPQNMNQAEDRIYRIGQYEDVHIYYPIVVNGGIELPVFLTVMEKFLVHLGVVEGKHITTKVGGGSNYLKELIKWL
jgi:SNF2 family DNA or RNA helicase